MSVDGCVPGFREVRAVYDDETITVYQAYSAVIADRAVEAQAFVAPFRVDRMTWIKPSFLWMMYRSGWAAKPGQERVLAVRMRRSGFEQALALACPARWEESGMDRASWERYRGDSPVRVQWDPERDRALSVLPWRSLQVGLGGVTVGLYIGEWIVSIVDVTDVAHAARDDPRVEVPDERLYPLPAEIARRIGATC